MNHNWRPGTFSLILYRFAAPNFLAIFNKKGGNVHILWQKEIYRLILDIFKGVKFYWNGELEIIRWIRRIAVTPNGARSLLSLIRLHDGEINLAAWRYSAKADGSWIGSNYVY